MMEIKLYEGTLIMEHVGIVIIPVAIATLF